ncbi:NADP-dependent oxidoreductase domain-containing protein [Cyathus striatus]|nr:NADP-dependent oxidoreductase domain-containing protein [Cyathus striatus]
MSLTQVGRTIDLNTGASIPIVGMYPFTTAKTQTSYVVSWLVQALKNGYRHIDTAVLYQTETAVGKAIRESGIPRDELFVTTKLPYSNHYGKVRESLEQSLQKLGLDYVDLYLIHWPQSVVYEDDDVFYPKNSDGSLKVTDSPNFHDAYAEMEKLFKEGKAKAIGVSNFSIKTLEELLTTAKVIPAVNQVELHPYLQQPELIEYCTIKGIIVAAYTPSGYSVVRNDPVIGELAKKYAVTPNQVILGWHIARDTVIISKSENDQRQKENIMLPKLNADDVAKIDGLDRGERVCNKPGHDGLMWGWTMERLGW